MDYKEYIKLGFERTDLNDKVVESITGYGGFALEKKISDRVMICANFGELDKPLLYIKMASGEMWHIINIPTAAVRDWLCERIEYPTYSAA